MCVPGVRLVIGAARRGEVVELYERARAQTEPLVAVESLRGAALTATDLRGGAAMIVAGLSAEGETVIYDEGHIRRGYERFDVRLRSLGADIVLDIS